MPLEDEGGWPLADVILPDSAGATWGIGEGYERDRKALGEQR